MHRTDEAVKVVCEWISNSLCLTMVSPLVDSLLLMRQWLLYDDDYRNQQRSLDICLRSAQVSSDQEQEQLSGLSLSFILCPNGVVQS